MAESSDQELQLTVPDTLRPARADKILAQAYPELSRSRWQKLFQSGRVWMEDRVLSQDDRLRPGDVIDFSLPPLEPLELRPVPMELAVLYEDADILVLDKAAGRVVHPGAGTGEDTLVHGLLHHCRGSLSGIGGKERPGIVHRLDKDTSGVLIVAKSDSAFQSLAEQFSSRSIRKFYTALVRGVPDPASGSVDEPIGRHAVQRMRMACRADGREARTDYALRGSWAGAAALLWLRIHTGRTHQIRVHMKQIGHPLLGDALYGYRPGALPAVPRIMLHATRLEFTHPATGQAMCMEAPLPADFTGVMDLLDAQFPDAESH